MTSILIRMPSDLKDRLHDITVKMNEQYPDANYSEVSIARQAIIRRVEELEEELKSK